MHLKTRRSECSECEIVTWKFFQQPSETMKPFRGNTLAMERMSRRPCTSREFQEAQKPSHSSSTIPMHRVGYLITGWCEILIHRRRRWPRAFD